MSIAVPIRSVEVVCDYYSRSRMFDSQQGYIDGNLLAPKPFKIQYYGLR